MIKQFNEILSLYKDIDINKKELANLEKIIEEDNCKAIQNLKPFRVLDKSVYSWNKKFFDSNQNRNDTI